MRWTDDGRFNLVFNDNCLMIRRPQNKQLRPECVLPIPSVYGGGDSVMMWEDSAMGEKWC